MDQRAGFDQIDIFLSYAWGDGAQFAARLHDDLAEASESFIPWYDQRYMHREDAVDRALEERILGSDVMVVVLTSDVPNRRWCRREILFAEKKSVRVILARMHEDVDDMISVIEKSPIDFAADPEGAFTQLVEALQDIAQAKGAVDVLDERLRTVGDVGSDARRRAFLEESRERLQAETLRAADLTAARRQTEVRIRSGMRREKERASLVVPVKGVRLVNEMPEMAQVKFQDRRAKLRELNEALNNRNIRVILLTGESGNGKTALLGEVRQRMARGMFPAGGTGFVYLAARGYRHVSSASFLDDLSRLIPDETRRTMVGRRIQARTSWQAALDEVLAALGTMSCVVAIDDFDDLVDEDGKLLDAELGAVMRNLVRRQDHAVRLLLVTRRMPWSLRLEYEPYAQPCELDEGLPDIKPFLLGLDAAQVLALTDVSNTDMHRLSVLSNGSPRFLELVYCVLRSDPGATVASVLASTAAGLEVTHREAMETLIHLVVNRLDRTQRRVVQALAAFGRPVLPEAVDFLLEEYVTGIDSAPILQRLTERRLVRRDGDRYFLPPKPDAEQVFATVPQGKSGDWRRLKEPFTRRFLQHRAAAYFRDVAENTEGDFTRLADLQPYFDEIDLLIAGEGYRPAVERMAEIDEKYLIRWGQSQSLIPWRMAVRGELPSEHLEAHNESFLIAARYGEEDQSESAVNILIRAIGQARERSACRDELRLRAQLADVEMDRGNLSLAADQYRAGVREFKRESMQYEVAWSRTSLGICLARLGKFRQAERQLNRARQLAAGLRSGQRDHVNAIILLNQGWLYGQLGKPEPALEAIDRGCEIARRMRSPRLEGRFLDGKAVLLCDSGKADEGIELARRAAEIGMRTRHIALAREAYVSLALAFLYTKNFEEAESAARAATDQPPGIRALGAWATYGTALFLRDKIDYASTAFHKACTEAWIRLDHEPGEYVALNAAALSLFGLHLCREPNRIERAIEIYRRAHAIAPRAEGARRRAVNQLRLFGGRATQDVLERVCRAVDEAP